MVNTSSLAALTILSATSTSAFVQVGRAPQQRTSPLHATEAFQRSLLAQRFGTNGVSDASAASVDVDSPDAEAKAQEQEKFQRSLLKAKLAFDAIDAALGTPKAPEVAEPAPIAVVAEEPVAVVAEPEPELEPVAVVVSATPEPEIPKPVIPVAVEPPKPKRVVKPTEFTVPREFAIVPINEATVQFTAGALGAAAGFVLGGPVLAAITASVFNYLSRKDEDKSSGSNTSAKKIVDAASQTALLAYNFLAQFEKDNKVVDSTFKLMEKVVDKAKEADSPAGDALVTLESTLGGIASKVEELNDDYDLVGGAGTVLESVADLVEIGVDKVVELNDEFKLTDRVEGVVKGAVGKVSEK